MNKCDKFENLISLYVDDMLLNSEIEELLEHLDACDHCHDYYADLKRTKESLKNIKIEYPEDLTQSILDKIQQNKEVQIVQYKPPKRKAFYGLLASCACLAIIVSTSSFSFSSSSNDSANTLTMSTSTTTIARSSSTTTEESVEGSDNIAASAPTGVMDSEIAVIDESAPADMPAATESQVEQDYAANDVLAEDDALANQDILLDDYAFVYEFSGTEELGDINGKILYFEENLIYLEVENTISVIESVVTALENSLYEPVAVDQNDYRISSEATSGIFIIHTN